MNRLALQIIKSKFFVWPVAVAFAVIVSVFTFFTSIPDTIIFPNSEGYTFDYYSDEAQGGKSQVLDYVLSDSVIRLEFSLKDGFHSPYVGLSVSPRNGKYIDVRRCNQINLSIRGRGIERVGVALFTPSYSYGVKPIHDNALYHSYLSISGDIRTYSIPIKQLKHPEWWEDLHQIPEGQRSCPDLSKILSITIGSAFTPSIGDTKALEIYSISFTRSNSRFFAILIMGGLIFILLLFVIHYLVLRYRAMGEQITVFYKPTDSISKVPIERCFEYINNNFDNCDISLELVSKETSISQRQITNAINSNFSCNFKTYINRIRITESKRLLEQTDLNIGEIAFRVGFNNQSHFNRVFRSEVQKSPGEYRERKGVN